MNNSRKAQVVFFLYMHIFHNDVQLKGLSAVVNKLKVNGEKNSETKEAPRNKNTTQASITAKSLLLGNQYNYTSQT